MNKALKIVIASTGRYHVLDLARELAGLGHGVKFLCYLPKWRARQFGLQDNQIMSVFWFCVPLIVLKLFFRGRIHKLIDLLLIQYVDFLVSLILPKCDVFIAMSHIFVRSERVAKARYNSLTICERGSTHALYQAALMKKLNSPDVSSDTIIKRELACYKNYDYIAVPTSFVAKTFIDYKYPKKNLLVNPYAVDLEMFSRYDEPKLKMTQLSAIFVGRWCLRKGVDILFNVHQQLKIPLIHIGPVDDYKLPKDDQFFQSLGVVDQRELVYHYKKASFAVLLSREEGLALVQAQALACGLPLICSQYTGGADLRDFIEIPEAIVDVNIHSQESIQNGYKKMSRICQELSGKDLLGSKGRDHLTWHSYARRYERNIFDILV